MPVSMYSVSVPVFMQHLNGLSGVLDKAAVVLGALEAGPATLAFSGLIDLERFA